MLLHRSGLAATNGLRRAAGTEEKRPATGLKYASPAAPWKLTQTYTCDVAAVRRCTGSHAVARSSSMSGVALSVTTAAAASSNGRFAGSSTAELEEWLVSNPEGLSNNPKLPETSSGIQCCDETLVRQQMCLSRTCMCRECVHRHVTVNVTNGPAARLMLAVSMH